MVVLEWNLTLINLPEADLRRAVIRALEKEPQPMTHPPPALPEDAGLTRGKPRTAFAQCDGCRLRGSQLCRIFQTAPVSGNHPPVRRRFGRGQRIVGQDDPGGFLGVIRRGFARRSVIQTSGRRILLGLAMPETSLAGF